MSAFNTKRARSCGSVDQPRFVRRRLWEACDEIDALRVEMRALRKLAAAAKPVARFVEEFERKNQFLKPDVFIGLDEAHTGLDLSTELRWAHLQAVKGAAVEASKARTAAKRRRKLARTGGRR